MFSGCFPVPVCCLLCLFKVTFYFFTMGLITFFHHHLGILFWFFPTTTLSKQTNLRFVNVIFTRFLGQKNPTSKNPGRTRMPNWNKLSKRSPRRGPIYRIYRKKTSWVVWLLTVETPKNVLQNGGGLEEGRHVPFIVGMPRFKLPEWEKTWEKYIY